MVIGLSVPTEVDLTGMVSPSVVGRLSSAAGGLGERPCRENGVLRASSAGRNQAICNCNVDIREWRLKVGIRLRFGIICRFVFIQVIILSSVGGRRGGDRCIGGAERGHHPSF